MRDELLDYYERELTFLRQMGAEFAGRYPKVAARLQLEPNRCEDPHVERLIEATAFLGARVHLKLDDEFPELSESLLTVLYPHFIRPIPPMSIVEFHLDPEQGKLTSGLVIPRGAMLYSKPVEGHPCKFRTCYETTIWPLSLSEARWVSPERLKPALRANEPVAAALSLELSCLPDLDFTKFCMSSLRLYLNGESAFVHTLYELLCNNCVQIHIRDRADARKAPLILPAKNLVPLGFDRAHAMLPYPSNSFTGYRLLQEYFAFPEKYFFFDLTGLEALSSSSFGPKIEIVFAIKPFEPASQQQVLELNVTTTSVLLNSAPIINLFPLTAEPILLDHTRFEYMVVPDVRRQLATEVFSVEEVSAIDRSSHQIVPFRPFYRFRHATSRGEVANAAFWSMSRKPSVRRNDEGSDVYLSLVDRDGRPSNPDFDTVNVHCMCSNRDLAHRLPLGNPQGDFEIEGLPALKRSVALRKPTAPIRPPWGKGVLWRLVSHLSLNYLSLVEEGKEAFQEMLRLYNFAHMPSLDKQIDGIAELTSRRHFARVVSEEGIGFVRGRQVEMVFDEEQFVGGGVYLFASVLEHFLGLYASLNSFSQLIAYTKQRKDPLRRWQPRAGKAILL